MSNYPAGPMEGSGIYDTEKTLSMSCNADVYGEDGEDDTECQFSGDVDVTFRGKRGCWCCPECGNEHEVEA